MRVGRRPLPSGPSQAVGDDSPESWQRMTTFELSKQELTLQHRLACISKSELEALTNKLGGDTFVERLGDKRRSAAPWQFDRQACAAGALFIPVPLVLLQQHHAIVRQDRQESAAGRGLDGDAYRFEGAWEHSSEIIFHQRAGGQISCPLSAAVSVYSPSVKVH